MGKQIFFHVGMGKTGTTFLQYNVFPRFKNIDYIQRTRYRNYRKLIQNSLAEKIFISKEFDQQMERKVSEFTKHFPDSTPIIVFRRHDDYIASQYRRFLKNGFRGDFKDFFNLEDTGFFKCIDLNYRAHVEMLGRYFKEEPKVLVYDDLKLDPQAFVSKFARIVGAEIDLNSINWNSVHTSYSEKQLKAIKKVSQLVDIRKRDLFQNRLINLLPRAYMSIVRYGTLYLSLFLPKKIYGDEPLIDPAELEAIRSATEADWNWIKDHSF